MRSILVALSLPCTLATAAGAQQTAKRAFTPADWYRITTVASPALSPDGRLVAFTVTTVREAENKRHSEIWVVPSAGGDPVRYTSPGTESSSPRWSPDGKYLFFTSQRPGGKGTTWALRMDQPAGEAMQIENYPSGSVPRDRRFAVWSDTAPADTAADSTRKADPWQAMQPTARPPFGAITKPLDAKRFDGRHVVDLGYKSNSRGYVPNRRDAPAWKAAQIWTQPFDGSAKRQLTSAPYSHRQAVVSPDGRWIAFVADARLRSDSAVEWERDSIAKLPYDPKRDEAERNDADIFVMPATGGQPRRLVEMVGTESDVAWSPDGRRLAFIGRPARTRSARVYIVDAQGGAADNVLGDWRYEPGELAWLPGGDLAMSAAVGGRTALFRISPKTRQIREVIGGRRRLSGFAFDAAGTKVAYISTDHTHPTELYVANADGTGERRLTGFNERLNAEISW